MMVLEMERAPDPLKVAERLKVTMNGKGLISKFNTEGQLWEEVPGDILGLWKQLRESVGVLEARTKEKVKFKVRSADELIDKIRNKANELGILIYPNDSSTGVGHVVEDGTLASVNLVVIAQSVSDGSYLSFGGFGLGADQMDKAGGKAGTYAFKQALIQALLAGGKANAKALGVADTDDTDSPIPGGVKKKGAAVTVARVTKSFEDATTKQEYDAAVQLLKQLPPAESLKLKDVVVAAKKRVETPDAS